MHILHYSSPRSLQEMDFLVRIRSPDAQITLKCHILYHQVCVCVINHNKPF